VFAAVIALSQQHQRAVSPAMVYLVLGAAAGLLRARWGSTGSIRSRTLG
jgi:hypothetical protein